MSYQNCKKTIGNYSYLIGDKIGDGCSSEVYRGIDDKSKQTVAIKVVHKLAHKRNEQMEMAQAEIAALKALQDCENVLNLKHVLETKNSIYIITELCEKGTLSEVLAQERKFSQPRSISMLQQLIKGYQAIHSRNLIHRDIKPANIFIGTGDILKIGDFGFAIDAGQCLHPSSENIGSPLYMPYESLVGNLYSFKSDIWAIGVTFLEMLTGKTPWKSKTEKELVVQLEKFTIDSALSIKITETSFTFLRRALAKDPEQRMGPEQLFSYSFTNQKPLLTKSEHQTSVLPQIRITTSYSNVDKLGGKAASSEKQAQKCDCPRGSDPSTEEHSRSKGKLHREKENPKFLIQPKPKVVSSAFVPSPRAKTSADKKMGGSLIGLEQVANKEKLHKMCENTEKGKDQKIEIKLNKALKGRSDSHEQKLTSRLQKQILFEVQSQINYFRFIFKLAKRMNETLKTCDENIKALKQQLLDLVHLKMGEVTQLRRLSAPASAVEAFKNTAEYANLLDVLKQYNERYAKEQERLNFYPATTQKDIATLLIYCLKVLYQNLVKVEADSQGLHRKKGLIIIAEDLLQLKRLLVLDSDGNWKRFHQDSDISKLLEKQQSEDNLKEQWLELKRQIRQALSI